MSHSIRPPRKYDANHPNIYVHMLDDFKDWIYVEDQALALKGKWSSIFTKPQQPLDLEIGCGNGFFFEHVVSQNQDRNFLGMELKFKPLVQTVRRVKKLELSNGRGIRFHAAKADHIFSAGEIQNVFIYFPDPWPKKKHAKNRLMKPDFLNMLYKIQAPGTYLDFKTDSEPYFDFACESAKSSPYKQIRYSRDLHNSEWATENFMTAFEKIFTKKHQPIFYTRLER